MACVENVAAFIENNLNNLPGEHLFNYINKHGFDMNTFVVGVRSILEKQSKLFYL
jgi:hypothetical protein